MGMNKRKKRKLDKEKKLEQMVLKTYYDFSNPGSYGGLKRLVVIGVGRANQNRVFGSRGTNGPIRKPDFHIPF